MGVLLLDIIGALAGLAFLLLDRWAKGDSRRAALLLPRGFGSTPEDFRMASLIRIVIGWGFLASGLALLAARLLQ